MDTLINFIQESPLFAMLSLTGVIIILRLIGIGKNLITLLAIIIIAGGSIYVAKTMGQ